ncbi:hypothetical protein GCM10009119_14740 [Algoriphagus jejuensis]|uniref:DUF4157 domain-containing protein n=1 Tax=Algoriphagus jejuensis TaxID=419934 RepID=A0ABN1MZH4_9BACT
MKNQIKILSILFLLAYNAALFSIYQKTPSSNSERYKILNDSTDLALEDFMRTYEVWSNSSASIRTQITLINENDSLFARAYIDRHNSWLKKDHNIDGTLFTHELYHARLAKAVAKELSEKINFYGYSREKALSKLSLYQEKLNYLQAKYDSESNHSRNRTMQNYWEYKIDSLYNNGAHYQVFDGVSAFFPTEPRNHTIITLDDTISGKKNIRNDLEFHIWNLKRVKIDSAERFNYFVYIISWEDLKDIFVNIESPSSNLIMSGYSKNSINSKNVFDRLFFSKDSNYYFARYSFPLHDLKDSTYLKIGDQFFNSIKFDSK